MAIGYAVEVLPQDGTVYTFEGHEYVVGRGVDAWGIHNLPVGTTVWDGGGSRDYFTKMEPGNAWQSSIGSRPQGIASDYNRLRSCPTTPPTFAAYRAGFADAVRATAARYSDTHLALAEQILADLGVNEPLAGSPVFHTTPGKDGDIAVFGQPDQERFTIFRHDGTTWVKAHGWYDSMLAAGQCRLVSGGREVGSDEEEIGKFKAAVWAAGAKAKQEHQWCSAYDKVLAEFDITDPDPVPDFTPWPDLVKGVEARENLPDGAVLGADRGDWGIFEKVHGEWVRKAGTRPLAAGTMRLMSPGGGACVRHAEGLKPFLPDARFEGDALVAWS